MRLHGLVQARLRIDVIDGPQQIQNTLLQGGPYPQLKRFHVLGTDVDVEQVVIPEAEGVEPHFETDDLLLQIMVSKK